EAAPDRRTVAGKADPDRRDGTEHDARGTEAALHRAALDQLLLERVERTVVGESGDRLDAPAFRLDGEHAAGVDGDAVEQNGACAADALATTVLRLRGSGLLAQ